MFFLNGQKINVESFCDGTPKLSVPLLYSELGVQRISWIYEEGDSLETLIMITCHLRDMWSNIKIVLHMPYIPNARMDRTWDSHPGTVFTLKHFCKVINWLEFARVEVCDAHSNVSLGLIDRVTTLRVEDFIRTAITLTFTDSKDKLLFFPDDGARKRYSKMFPEIPSLYGIKTRESGRVKSIVLSGDIPEKTQSVLIVDDICSYGGTFIKAAESLWDAGIKNINLYVTHCENSILKGKLLTESPIDMVYTTASIFTKEHPRIRVLEYK